MTSGLAPMRARLVDGARDKMFWAYAAALGSCTGLRLRQPCAVFVVAVTYHQDRPAAVLD